MDGICEVVAPRDSGVWLEIGGDVYRLSMLTVRDWSEITNEVKQLRVDPLALGLRMVAGLEDRDSKVAVLEKTWQECRRSQIVPEHEVMAWSATPEGATYFLWRSLLHRHPDLSLDVVRSWVRPIARDGAAISQGDVCDLIDRVHALPPTGPT